MGISSEAAQIAGPCFRVIEPKLMPPRVYPGTLRRARLLEMLGDDGAGSLTVLNALWVTARRRSCGRGVLSVPRL